MFLDRRRNVTFHGEPPKEVMPSKCWGKIVTWEMSTEEIRLLSDSCNDNQSFLIEYTPYDSIVSAKRILELCFEKQKGKAQDIFGVEVNFPDPFGVHSLCHLSNIKITVCALLHREKQPTNSILATIIARRLWDMKCSSPGCGSTRQCPRKKL